MFIIAKLAQYFTLVNHKEFTSLVRQDGYASFVIIVKIDQYVKLAFRME
jgi:hypothetical protein